MIEILQVIALLCQFNSDRTLDTVHEAQLRCQQKYVACVDAKRGIFKPSDFQLWACVKEHKL